MRGWGVEDWFGSTATFEFARAALESVEDAVDPRPPVEYEREEGKWTGMDFV